MTVYELIRALVDYSPDAEVQFIVGDFNGYSLALNEKENFFNGQKHPELHIKIMP